MIRMRPSRTAWSAGSASGLIRTYTGSVPSGSNTHWHSYVQPDQVAVELDVRLHRKGRVGEERLGARGGDGNGLVARFARGAATADICAAAYRVANVGQEAVLPPVDHLEVGQGGA